MDNSNGLGFGSLPIATSLIKTMEEDYEGKKGKLTEAEKEELMNQYKDAPNSDMAEKILENNVPLLDKDAFLL